MRDFDALGRLKSEVNNLGTFTYQYDADNASPKVDAVLYPNRMQADYDDYTVTGSANDARLKEIHNTTKASTSISKFSYQYDPSGRISQWSQQQGATTASLRDYSFAYDRTAQLTDAVMQDNSGTHLKIWSWQYDAAGNRVRESEEVSSTYSQHNALNQLKQIGGAGTTLVEGLVDEPAFVKVNGQEAIVLSQPGGDFLFRKQIAVNEGNNTITIEATDASGNSASNSYSVVVGGLQKTLEYDLNGNLLFQRSPDGTVLQAYQWDAKNRLVKILEGTQETEFAYDGKDRRVLKIERTHGSEISRTHYIWEGSNIVQSRAADASTLQRNYFQQGFQENAQNYYYTKDHLGSIREVVASDGITIEAAYDYSPWGEVTKIAGTGVESDFLYTGHFYHGESDLHLTLYRAYNPELSMWLSRDPFGSFTSQLNASLFGTDAASFYEQGIYDPELLPNGPNIYGYVSNNTVNLTDPTGEVAPLVVIGAGIVGGLIMDYAIDKIKNRNVRSVCPNSSSTGNPALNAGVGGSVAATGRFQRKPRHGIAGGGRSGDRTSVASRANHELARRGTYSIGTRNLITKGLRKVPYVGAAISAAQLGDAIFNPTEEECE